MYGRAALNSFCALYSLSRLLEFAPAKIASTQIIRSLSSDQMRLGACRLGHLKLSVLGRGRKLGPSPIVEGATCAMFILLGLEAESLRKSLSWTTPRTLLHPIDQGCQQLWVLAIPTRILPKIQPRKLVLLFEGLATSAETAVTKLQSGFMIKLSPAQVKLPCVINRS